MNKLKEVISGVNNVSRISVIKDIFGYSIRGSFKGSYFEAELNPYKECLEIETRYRNKKELIGFVQRELEKGIASGTYDEELNPLYLTIFA